MQPKIKINSLYNERGPQTELRRAMDEHRFCVLVTHRQMGKTVAAVNELIDRAISNPLPGGRYFYIAPQLKQAKLIAWDYLKHYISPFQAVQTPDGKTRSAVIINESELKVTFKTKNAPYIRILGADNPDALRGTYADGVVLDEYGDMKPNVFTEIIRPMLLSRNGWVLFAGTPKGQNQFYNTFQLASKSFHENPKGDWWCGVYRADKTQVIPEEELNKIKNDTPANIFRQEYLCDFTASADNVLIPIDLVLEAQQRAYGMDAVNGAPRVLGVDPARFGDDKSIIYFRQGLQAFDPFVFEKLDNMAFAARVAEKIEELHPDAVFIDAGNGAGVIDRLRQLNYRNIVEVPFGGKPNKAGQYLNKRAELWGELRDWLKAGGALPKNDTDLVTDLSTPVYDFDNANRLRLESKEHIKERLGRSPDRADALALTFAAPVRPQNDPAVRYGQSRTYEMEYEL